MPATHNQRSRPVTGRRHSSRAEGRGLALLGWGRGGGAHTLVVPPCKQKLRLLMLPVSQLLIRWGAPSPLSLSLLIWKWGE